ncbi:TPA: DUF1003 domain-containing protein [Candidatus Woesearchaeota archaeon]|nr:DUF1003 domain-containing protein [Candidatus Woesearchaeota archaeon]HIH31635.1 DUF1003 domain-containing protein [Candidatus Woesearchaeota archaeon]HIH55323.1 DUF1003 domain-containing protein [Candidatus Woesearchaeota archaeon]HIJ02433.1 DUF1003 domain-containing protein [Candidatus Woesearchaeota archaeon]HIJ14062.1 DUF1003 domain-containing protein [Candidatus Woesearchaeota archaeon]
MVKRKFSVIPRSMKSKYSWGDKVPGSGIYECSICSNYQAFKRGEFFSQCQDCINSHTEEENKWFVTNEFLYFMSKNMNIEFDKISTLQVKIADKITSWAGSMSFVFIHIIWFALWVLANLNYFGPKYVFDPFPFGLLTMIVSLEAIFLATFIMISQNIYSQKSELRAEHEYQVNLEAEKNVAEILAIIKEMRKVEELKDEKIEELKETIEEFMPEEPQPVETVTVEDTPVPLEAVEHETFEEHQQILEEAGIDVIEESAPPVIQEKKRRGRKKKVKELILEGLEQTHVDMNLLAVPKEIRKQEKTPEVNNVDDTKKTDKK